MCPCSVNHRMAWVEKAHNAHPVPTPRYVQGHQPAARAAQSHIQPGLECLQGWGIHSLLGQPVQCVTTLWGKNFHLKKPFLLFHPSSHVVMHSTHPPTLPLLQMPGAAELNPTRCSWEWNCWGQHPIYVLHAHPVTLGQPSHAYLRTFSITALE